MGQPVGWFESHGSGDGMIDTHGEGGINGGIAPEDRSSVTIDVSLGDVTDGAYVASARRCTPSRNARRLARASDA